MPQQDGTTTQTAFDRLRARSTSHLPDLSQYVVREMPEEEKEFWLDISPVLKTIYQAAKATRNGPWNMLGTHILQTVAAVAPEVYVADIADKGVISLNMNLMSVGRSGMGKTSGIKTLRKISPLAVEIERKPVGTGEGIRDTYGRNVPRDDKTFHVERTAYNCIFDADEVGTLAALKNRSGATLLATMRTMYTADPIGQTNKADNTVIIASHTYRGCIHINGQPTRLASLMTQEEIDSGTPQRFFWLPTKDEYLDISKSYDMPDVIPIGLHPDLVVTGMNSLGIVAATPGHTVAQQLNGTTRPPKLEISVPASLAARVDEYVAANQLEAIDDTRSHEILQTIKMSVGVAWIHGRVEPTEDDVAIASVIVQKSIEQYREVDKLIKHSKNESDKTAARRTGIKQAITEKAHEDVNVRETIRKIRLALNRLGDDESITRKALAQKVSSRLNPFVDEALRQLEAQGFISVTNGKRGSKTISRLQQLDQSN